MKPITIFRTVLSLLTVASILFFSSCTNQKDHSSSLSTEAASDESMVETVIRNGLDERKVKYHRYMNQDSTITFEMHFKFDDDNDNGFMLYINIFPDDVYQMVSILDKKIPNHSIDEGIRTINDYNLYAYVVSGCIGPEGQILLRLSRNTDGNTFSKPAFGADFHMIMTEPEKLSEKLSEKIQLTER